MKKLITALLLTSIACTGQAQSLIITNECKSSIDTPGEITINPNANTTVTLRNVELKCSVLTFGANVTNIEIIGTVKIKCNRIIIDTVAGVAAQPNIIISGNSGTLSFEYPASTFSNARGFELKNNSKVKLNFIQN